MKLKDVEILPGVIIDCEDPKKLGRVKATVPSLFDSTQMNKDGMPWIYPINMSGYQRFSKLQEGSKIWVFKQTDNYKEFWYMPMFEMNGDTREIISDYEEPEVVIARNSGANSVYIYYTSGDGIMLKMGDNSTINMKPDGEILLKSGDGQISIRGNKVYIGSDSAKEQAVLGNSLNKVLKQLATDLQTLSTAAGSPMTSNLVTPFMQASQNLQMSIDDKILCKDTIVS